MSAASFVKTHRVKIASVLFVLVFLALYFSPILFVYIYPGQAGVLFHSLSDEPLSDKTYREGLYVVAPWNRMYVYDITKQKRTEDVQTLTRDGLPVTVRVSVIYRPDVDQLRTLAREVGPDYAEKILVPFIHSATRKIVGHHTPEDLYTGRRQTLHAEIQEETAKQFEGIPFLVENTIVENVIMPDSLNASIEQKLKYQQDALAYQFLLEKQRNEASRMEIEAEGIKTYQDIVGSNLTPELLEWLEIRALYDAANSENSKVIIMGAGEETPVVLDVPD